MAARNWRVSDLRLPMVRWEGLMAVGWEIQAGSDTQHAALISVPLGRGPWAEPAPVRAPLENDIDVDT
jgi:hypothetical protein